MNVVGVSACLLGFRCRYNGKAKTVPELVNLFRSGEAIPICPEVFGGLPVPRPPSYICGGTGSEFWKGKAKVLTTDGIDVSDSFRKGAEISLVILKLMKVERVFLKEKSPSCGARFTYSDGNTLVPGMGVAASLFLKEGIELVSH